MGPAALLWLSTLAALPLRTTIAAMLSSSLPKTGKDSPTTGVADAPGSKPARATMHSV
jgi:hypothetical protein